MLTPQTEELTRRSSYPNRLSSNQPAEIREGLVVMEVQGIARPPTMQNQQQPPMNGTKSTKSELSAP